MKVTPKSRLFAFGFGRFGRLVLVGGPTTTTFLSHDAHVPLPHSLSLSLPTFMTPAVLAIPNGLFRLKSILCPLSTSALKAFSSSLALDTEETPAMQALRDVPYPSVSPDPSLFESWSNEYNKVRLPRVSRAPRSTGGVAFTRRANTGHNASGVLEQLSRDGKFAEAEEIRQELVAMNIPIRPSSAYSRVARNILRQRPWPPNRTEMFASWLSLLPDFAQDNNTTRLGDIKSALLFNSNQLDLKTVALFGVILSSKGYIRIVGANVIACLTRYAHPDTSSRILNEMITADDEYKRNKHGIDTRKGSARRLWSVAVRTHCTAGRPGVALEMAKRAHGQGILLTQYSYQYLLGKLEASGLDELAKQVRAFPGCEFLDVAKRRHVIEEVSGPESISLHQNKFVNRSLALTMLQHSSRSGLSACATDIVPYFDLYKTDLRGGSAVNWLRKRAYRVSFTALSTVLLAELLHHHRRGQFKYVLWIFQTFFHVVAVPSENIARRLWKRHHYPPHMHLQHWSLPPRITKTTFNLPSRLWPSAHHTALVWSALVHLCETEDELFALYDQLLQHSARSEKTALEFEQPHRHSHRHQLHQRHRSHGDIITPVMAPADRHDAAHFRPFLIAFTLLRGAQYGLRVLDDMQARGIAPSAQILSTAAGLQARHGEPALALRMLDVMRGLLLGRGEHGEGENNHVDVDDEEAVKTRRQRLLLAAYTSVMRGFADRRELAHARQVAEMLVEQLEYVEGGGDSPDGDGDGDGNARTDAVLQFLRRLEAEGPRARPEQVDDGRQQQRHLYRFLKKRDSEVRLPSRLESGGHQAYCDAYWKLTRSLLLVHCAGRQDIERRPCYELTRNRSARRANTSLLAIKGRKDFFYEANR